MPTNICTADTMLIDPGDGKRKAIVVSVEAVKGLDKAWADYARENDLAILPWRGNGLVEESWKELCKTVHHAFAYGLEANDMNHHEVIGAISFALDQFAKQAGFREHDWDTDYEDLYGGNEDAEA